MQEKRFGARPKWSIPRRLAVLGVVLLVGGLYLGFRPLSDDGESCGTAFGGGKERTALFGSDTSYCSEVRESARKPALFVLGAGGAAIVGAWVIAGARRSSS